MKEGNLKKTGFKIFLLTVILIIADSYIGIPIDGYVKLAMITFGFGLSFLLIFFGGMFFPMD